jgi:DNA polymerase-1
MLVRHSQLDGVIQGLRERSAALSVDIETSGLRPYHGDFLVGLAIYDGYESYYFNFNPNEIEEGVDIFPYEVFTRILSSIAHRIWIGANFKFDMHFMSVLKTPVSPRIYDVLVMARIEYNAHMRYRLKDCAARIGESKSDGVEEYLKKHKLWQKREIPGKRTKQRFARFDLIPVSVFAPYAEQDVIAAYNLYLHQSKVFGDWFDNSPSTSVLPLVENECELTSVCFKIESRGMQLDVAYTQEALEYELRRARVQEYIFEKLAGVPFVDHAYTLSPAFEKLGLTAGKTELGNDSFTDDVLTSFNHPLADCVLAFRDAKKRAGSYYSSFLYHADSMGIVRCNIRQSATFTGRFAINDPALQTLASEDDGHYKVRNCFVARPGYKLVSIDYKAFEFRAMLDMANEKVLANEIESGADPHQKTADMIGVSRKFAKTLNFGIIYGMGNGKLARSLGVTLEAATDIKKKYLSALSGLMELIWDIKRVVSTRGFVLNRFKRRYFFPDPKFGYKALNYLIQGGTADAVKHAMVRIDKFLTDYDSYMILQVHDEILFEIKEEELHIIPTLKQIMREAYPHSFHKMDCEESIGNRWGEL